MGFGAQQVVRRFRQPAISISTTAYWPGRPEFKLRFTCFTRNLFFAGVRFDLFDARLQVLGDQLVNRTQRFFELAL